MKRINTSGSVTTAFVLLLICLFAFTALLVLFQGVNVYRGISERGTRSFDARVCLSYIAAQVRNGDREGSVGLDEFDGIPALVLSRQSEGVTYETLIYFFDGSIRELFRETGVTLMPGDGLIISPCDSLGFTLLDESLLQVECGGATLCLALRAGGTL